MAADKAPKRKRLTAEERRASIIEAARRVFLEHGYTGARTRQIAEEAGVTEALLYRFFPSKTEIFKAAVHEPLQAFLASLLEAASEIDTRNRERQEGLRQINEMLLRFMADSAPFLAVVLLSELSEGRRFYTEELYPELNAPIRQVVSKVTGWRQRGQDGSVIFASMFGTHMGLAIDALLRHSPLDPIATAEQMTRLFSEGMPEDLQATPIRLRSSAR